jgi:hypothetical protein
MLTLAGRLFIQAYTDVTYCIIATFTLLAFPRGVKPNNVTQNASIISVRLRESPQKLLIRIFFMLGNRGVMVRFPTGETDLCLVQIMRTASGHTHLLPATFLPVVKRQLTETSVEVKDAWSFNSTIPLCFLEFTGTILPSLPFLFFHACFSRPIPITFSAFC